MRVLQHSEIVEPTLSGQRQVAQSLLQSPQPRVALRRAFARHDQRAFYPYVKQILSKYPNDVRVVMPYVLFHKGSEETGVGLNEKRAREEMHDAAISALIKADEADVNTASKGTPTFFVNGMRLTRLSPEDLSTAVERALQGGGNSHFLPSHQNRISHDSYA